MEKQAPKALNELRIRARRSLKWNRLFNPDLQLKSSLKAFAVKAGFSNWQHARYYLGGTWSDGQDAGSFWYAPRCTTLLNLWCRNLEEARELQPDHPDCLLLPYKRQYVLASPEYLEALGLPSKVSNLPGTSKPDMVTGYGGVEWDALSMMRINAIFGTEKVRLNG